MRHVYTLCQWLWGVVVVSVITGVAVNWLFAPPREEVRQFLAAHWHDLCLALLALGLLHLWSWLGKRRYEQAEHLRQLRAHFALCKPATEICLDDVDPYDRPHDHPYIPRTAVVYAPQSPLSQQQAYETTDLVQALQQGRSVILIGQPLEGKSRTLYEIITHMTGYDVVRPFRDRPIPVEACAVFAQRRVLVLLDESNHYAPAGGPDLLEWGGRLTAVQAQWAIAATCQDGAQLGVVQGAYGTTLSRIYENIPLKLRLRPLTAAEKEHLARDVGRISWVPDDAALFPTPGAITMDDTLQAMHQRFLVDVTPEQRDTLRELVLLEAAGILPHTEVRLQAVVRQIFQRTLHLADALEALADTDFIRRPMQPDRIQPEPAYLHGVVTYREGHTPEEHLLPLAQVLEDLGDVDGLLSLGRTYRIRLQQAQDSLAVVERALRLQPEHPMAWHDKGVVLGQLGRPGEALVAYEQALTRQPEDAATWHRKGMALWELGRHEEALVAYEQALARRPEHAATWHNKGVVLGEMGRPGEALVALEEALARRPEDAATWHQKGWTLGHLGRSVEALVALEEALARRPEDAATWHGKGVALAALQRPAEARRGLSTGPAVLRRRAGLPAAPGRGEQCVPRGTGSRTHLKGERRHVGGLPALAGSRSVLRRGGGVLGASGAGGHAAPGARPAARVAAVLSHAPARGRVGRRCQRAATRAYGGDAVPARACPGYAATGRVRPVPDAAARARG